MSLDSGIRRFHTMRNDASQNANEVLLNYLFFAKVILHPLLFMRMQIWKI